MKILSFPYANERFCEHFTQRTIPKYKQIYPAQFICLEVHVQNEKMNSSFWSKFNRQVNEQTCFRVKKIFSDKSSFCNNALRFPTT